MKAPVIQTDDDGNYIYGTCYLNVVRGFREVGDHKRYMKSDNPMIMSRDPSILRIMETWQENDIVQVKGVVAAKNIRKASYCQHCGAKNTAEGSLVYVNPIFVMTMEHAPDINEALKRLSEMREISNQVYVLGTLCRDPKKVTPKEGLTVTQYQIALNRKYFIRTDPPEIKSDYPWVKSYGENAIEDRQRLHVGSKVFIDGCLQARSVQKHIVCSECGQQYNWKDRAMEIVPYETEYVGNFYTEEEIEEKRKKEAKDAFRSIFGRDADDEITSEEQDDGYDVMI